MTDRTSTRSAGYQHLILEISSSHEQLAEWSDLQGLTGMLNQTQHNEELLDLKEQLVKEFWRIVDTQLTERQAEVLHLCAEGLTQIEIAKKLGVNQSSVTKSLHGNTDYRNGKRTYGGAKKRLLKIADKDEVIQAIFKRMAELQSDM